MFQIQLLLILILVPASSSSASLPDACRLPVFYYPTRPTDETAICKSRNFQGNFEVFIAVIKFPFSVQTKENLMQAFEPDAAIRPECVEILFGYWMIRKVTDPNPDTVLNLEATCGSRTVLRLELRPFADSPSPNGTLRYSGGEIPVKSFQSVLNFARLENAFSPYFPTSFYKQINNSNVSLVHVISNLHVTLELPAKPSEVLRYDRSAAAGCRCDGLRARFGRFGRPVAPPRGPSIGVQIVVGIAGSAVGLTIVAVTVAVVLSKRSARTVPMVTYSEK